MSKTSLFVFAILLFEIVSVEFIDGLTVPSLHEQCTSMGFEGVCRTSAVSLTGTSTNRCRRKLACAVLVGKKYYKQTGELPLDGTACGKNMMCRQGRCIDAAPGIVYTGPDTTKPCKGIIPTNNKCQMKPKNPPRPAH